MYTKNVHANCALKMYINWGLGALKNFWTVIDAKSHLLMILCNSFVEAEAELSGFFGDGILVLFKGKGGQVW